MIEVRKIQPKDISIIWKKIKEHGINENAAANLLESFMLVSEGKIICGLGCGIIQDSKCLLNWIQIDEEFRRNRLGTALVKTILNNAELNGARSAYIHGNCDEFAVSLKFAKLSDKDEIESINAQYLKVYGVPNHQNLFKADLTDYFKPCCAQ